MSSFASGATGNARMTQHPTNDGGIQRELEVYRLQAIRQTLGRLGRSSQATRGGLRLRGWRVIDELEGDGVEIGRLHAIQGRTLVATCAAHSRAGAHVNCGWTIGRTAT